MTISLVFKLQTRLHLRVVSVCLFIVRVVECDLVSERNNDCSHKQLFKVLRYQGIQLNRKQHDPISNGIYAISKREGRALARLIVGPGEGQDQTLFLLE
ncbi:hypothetical protein OG21DRAFT_1175190 [Imleria badia]|nr:hypothetical protein OG21DRAFT_1175190 [Imleria badia]